MTDVAAKEQRTDDQLPASQVGAGELIVYATSWCGDCRRSKRFLDQHGIAYRWVDVDEDRVALALVQRINRGYNSVPTIVFPDGSTLTEPSNAELARKLGVRT